MEVGKSEGLEVGLSWKSKLNRKCHRSRRQCGVWNVEARMVSSLGGEALKPCCHFLIPRGSASSSIVES